MTWEMLQCIRPRPPSSSLELIYPLVYSTAADNFNTTRCNESRPGAISAPRHCGAKRGRKRGEGRKRTGEEEGYDATSQQ